MALRPKSIVYYREPTYPDRLTLWRTPALRDRQPRRWLRPAMAAAMAGAMAMALTGCPTKPPAGDVTGQQVEPQAGDSGARLAGAPPMLQGTTTEEELPKPEVNHPQHQPNSEQPKP